MRAEGSRQKAKGILTTNHDLTDRPRGAMTLFEVLLVLVLLVVVGSLAAPLFEGSFSSIRLRRGTDQVVASWAQARTHAIESGQIYQFRFEPAGSDYRVDPWTGGVEGDLVENELTTSLSKQTADEIELAEWKLETTLPEEIVFSSAERVSQDELGQRTVTRLDQDSTTQWSTPILFFPDGTSSEASLLLETRKKLYRRATLRAMTGVARASDVLSREEVDRLQTR